MSVICVMEKNTVVVNTHIPLVAATKVIMSMAKPMVVGLIGGQVEIATKEIMPMETMLLAVFPVFLGPATIPRTFMIRRVVTGG